ncbi:hypothetical protein AGJ20_12750 [Cronobacter sakazakii]|nr:hypothetical protein [Cronobacter sakazakii]
MKLRLQYRSSARFLIGWGRLLRAAQYILSIIRKVYTAISGCQRFAENIFSRSGKRKSETAQSATSIYLSGKFSAGIYNHFINLKRI